MDADFWGLLIVPGKKYSNESHKPIRVTTACFGENVVKGSSTCVYLQINDNEFALCKLSESKNESQSLDTYLPTDSEFSFRVSGPNEVHLTGHIVDAPESEDDYDEDDDEDELMQKFMRGEMGSDSDDESFEGSDSDASLEEANIEEIEEESEDETPKSKKGAATKAPEKNITPAPIEKATPSKEADASVDLSKLTKKQRKALRKKAEKENEAQPEAVKVQEKRKADEIKSAEPKSENKKPKVDSKQQKASEAKPNTAKPSIITHPNGLIVEDKTVGTGAVAKRGSKVSMRYIGKLKNGKVFDSNSSGPAFSFKLGAGQVIRGWDLGIEGMKIGGERRLVIPASLGYGKRGAAPDIPSNATLEFDVKLLAVK